jgi:hypothetical protein
MKLLAFLGALVLIASQGATLRSRIETWLEGKSDSHAEAAIALRCDSDSTAVRSHCADELRRDFESGVLEPESIVKRHCTRFPNDWASAAPASPLPICAELYGGWIEG